MTWNWEKMKKTIDDAAQKAQGVAKDIKEDYEKYLENEKNKQNQDDVIEAEIIESMESLNNSNNNDNNDNNNSETINSANITEKPIQVKISDNLNNSDITVEIKQETNVEHKQDELNNLSDLNKSNDSDDYNESLDLSESKETETLDALASNHTNELNIKELFDNQVAENKELDELLEKIAILSIVGINISEVKESFHNRIKELIEQATDIGLENTEIYRRYKEILYFLDK